MRFGKQIERLTDEQTNALRRHCPQVHAKLKGRVPDNLDEIKADRRRLVKESRELLDSVEAEKRDLTTSEDAACDGLITLIDNATVRLERKEDCEMAKEHRRGAEDGSPAPAFGEVRAYRPAERLVDHLRFDLPDGIQAEELNIGRWFKGIVTGDWKGAEAEKRTMLESLDVVGGYLVPSPLAARLIDLARNKARVVQAGALTIPMESSELIFAKITGDPTAYWKPEAAEGTFSDMSFGRVTMRAKTLIALCKMSVELAEDAKNLSGVVEDALSSALGLEMDRAFLYGVGAGEEPAGLRIWSGIQTIDMGANGSTLSGYDDFSNALQLIQAVNGPSEGLSIIYAARTAGDLDRKKDGQGLPLQPPESWGKMRKYVTNQVPVNLTKGTSSDASDAFVGDFSQLYIGMRTEITIEASRQAAAGSDSAFRDLQVWTRAYLRADCALAKEDHFVLIDGITPAS